MRQGLIAEMIRRALRDQYDGVLSEPLPKRWVDLINSLDQREQQARGLDREHAIKTLLETACGSALIHGPKGGRFL
jgi:anti-sigma factor NepR-like protein